MKCCHCKEDKPDGEFYRDKYKASGFKPRCKPCDLLSRDKSKRAEYEKTYWDTRRDERRKMILLSHSKNKEHHKQQRQKYLQTAKGKEMHRKQTQTRYARMKKAFVGSVDPITLFNNQGGACYICGGVFEFSEMECDHIVPIAAGGKHEYLNVKMACVKCNRSKGAKPLQEVRHQMV